MNDGAHPGLFAVHPDPPPPELVKFFDLDGYRWKAVASAEEAEGDDREWEAVLVAIGDNPEQAWRVCSTVIDEHTPVLVMVGGGQLDQLQGRDDSFDDFIITPFHPEELRVRVDHLLAKAGKGARSELVTYGPLSLNVETYQAMLDGRSLDLTFMEYELLRFLTASPGQVFTRETLLNRVWGYEYYGGARTVDVHVRRLRAKLGEEHSSLISTVRGVGYKLGQSRWQG
jgi:DNA-binding response OmpR family regulator